MNYAPEDHLRIVKTINDERSVVLSGFFRLSDSGERLLGGFKTPFGQFVEVAEGEIEKAV